MYYTQVIMPPAPGALSDDRRPSVRLSACLSVCLSVRLSVRPSVCPSVRLSACLSVSLSVRLSDVAYIGSNSKTKRPRKTKLCTWVPQVTCDSHADFTVKRSRSRG